jgi:hypothetical protein
MPRLDIARTSFADESTTNTDFGASGGVNFIFNGGFGAHATLDATFGDATVWLFGGGVSYYFGG